MPTYLERALFLVAPQNFGKSTLLRSMFNDAQLGVMVKYLKRGAS